MLIWRTLWHLRSWRALPAGLRPERWPLKLLSTRLGNRDLLLSYHLLCILQFCALVIQAYGVMEFTLEFYSFPRLLRALARCTSCCWWWVTKMTCGSRNGISLISVEWMKKGNNFRIVDALFIWGLWFDQQHVDIVDRLQKEFWKRGSRLERTDGSFPSFGSREHSL